MSNVTKGSFPPQSQTLGAILVQPATGQAAIAKILPRAVLPVTTHLRTFAMRSLTASRVLQGAHLYNEYRW